MLLAAFATLALVAPADPPTLAPTLASATARVGAARARGERPDPGEPSAEAAGGRRREAGGVDEDETGAPSLRPGELLVKLAPTGAEERSAAEAVGRLGRRTGLALVYQRPTLAGWHLVLLPGAGAEATRAAAVRLSLERDVAAALPNLLRQAQRMPDDPFLDDLWGFALIEAEAAWELSTGSSSQRIGVVDSGTTRSHVDLAGRVARGWDFIRSTSAAEDGDGRDNNDDDRSYRATHFHGTHVAGTILARADDGFGVPGLNWHAGLVSARALGKNGRGDLLDIVEAAAWMAGIDVEGAPPVGNDRVSVINLSLGSRGRCSAFERDAYEEILARGVVLVAAAGNTGTDTSPGAPANCPGVIAVGAVDADAALAPYSAFSSRIDVLAPGGDDTGRAADWILSLDGGDDEGHAYLYGTSMAAPHVTGVVSLMQAVAPDLDPAMVRDILQESPWTCEGCEDEALLQADHAVATAAERQAELEAAGAAGDGVAGPDAEQPPLRDGTQPDAYAPVPLELENPAHEGGGCNATPPAAGLHLPVLLRRIRKPARNRQGAGTAVRPSA